MKLSPWRLVHLWLAQISSVFLIIASLTGAILAFEPVYENSHAYQIKGADQLTLAQVLDTVRAKHDEVLSLTRDENGFVALTSFEYDQPVYINPYTAEVIGESFETPRIFEWSRALHRSLFLKSTGRFIIGITSLLLVFICFSGLWLVLQKQGGWKKLLTSVVKNDFFQDYHTKLGRLSLVVLLIVSLTGTILFLNRFELLSVQTFEHQPNTENIVETDQLSLVELPALNGVTLSELRELNLPFAPDPEEFYDLKLNNRELLINQFNGEIISQIDYPLVNLMHDLSFALHTGEGTTLWAIVLGLSSLAILFFIYSGLAIFFKRDKSKVNNPFDKHEAEYVVLVGSEQGSTFRFARALHKALLGAGFKSYVTDLNSYEPFQKMQKLLVLTATYGLGEATSNAQQFLSRLKAEAPTGPVDFAVLGFGSTNYPDFCQYAIEVDEALGQLPNASPLLPLEKIDKASKSTFLKWVGSLNRVLGSELEIDELLLIDRKPRQVPMQVKQKENSPNKADATFLLELTASMRKLNGYRSGDLMGIIPPGSDEERLYSMAVDRPTKTITLSIRKHEHGLCSNYLSALTHGGQIKVALKENLEFRFPETAPGIIMIANGTGIAPFLGMIAENQSKKPIQLFWGGQNQDSYRIYQHRIEDLQQKEQLSQLHLAFSREGKKQYVQDLVSQQQSNILELLDQGHVLMICGGLNMQKAVEEVLDQGCRERLGHSLELFKEKDLIKADCY